MMMSFVYLFVKLVDWHTYCNLDSYSSASLEDQVQKKIMCSQDICDINAKQSRLSIVLQIVGHTGIHTCLPKTAIISRAQPRSMSDAIVAIAPPIMNGRLFPPSDPAVVALQPNVGLHKHTREGTGDPDQRKHRLAKSEGQQIRLRIDISAVVSIVETRLTEPLDVSTDQPIWRPRPPRVKRNRKKLLLVSSNSGK